MIAKRFETGFGQQRDMFLRLCGALVSQLVPRRVHDRQFGDSPAADRVRG